MMKSQGATKNKSYYGEIGWIKLPKLFGSKLVLIWIFDCGSQKYFVKPEISLNGNLLYGNLTVFLLAQKFVVL